jgi:cysteine desulfurase
VNYRPVVFGGAQEGGHRPGTENVPFAVGFATALALAQETFEARAEHVSSLRNYFFTELEKAFPSVVVHGSREHRVANNVNISIPGIDGEYAVVWLDTRGVSASTKSACNGSTGGSHVVRALCSSDELALGTIRFSLGEETTKKDIDYCVQTLKEHIELVRGKLDQP